MELAIQYDIEATAMNRVEEGAMESEADFFTGAMAMYLALNPKSEEDGSWCPPSWIFTLMAGDSIVEKVREEDEAAMEADRQMERAEIAAENAYDAQREISAEMCYDDRYDDYY